MSPPIDPRAKPKRPEPAQSPPRDLLDLPKGKRWIQPSLFPGFGVLRIATWGDDLGERV